MQNVRIGLIGDHNPDVVAHRAIPTALELAGKVVGCNVEPVWIGTTEVEPDPAGQLPGYDGLWCVPASPYASMEGALRAICFARERQVPFLGTCGGFQHVLIEYARDVLGIASADHAESNPDAEVLFITPLTCALRGVKGPINLAPGSRIREMYGEATVMEEYMCGFGLNPSFRALLENSPLHVTGDDPSGDARVLELEGPPFYMATLFQPERSAFGGSPHPLIAAYVQAAVRSSIRVTP
ncbi:MAG: hypothetical protein M3014_15110 [Chloroflexota bacterium]|nr:hypothetical protein [Chloroflexota bacterium]